MSDYFAIEVLLWIILMIGVAYLLWRIHREKAMFERFENANDVASKIIRIYYDTLKRAPTSEELRKHTTDITANKYDYNELELRIINSDEYQRLIKTQTDTILPETNRMLEEQDLVARVKRIYLKIREKACPEAMYHPLKDLYIYFDYNLYKFIALLRETKYVEFEDIVKKSNNLDKERLIDLYLSIFDNSKLNYDASAFEEMDKALPEGTRISDSMLSDKPPDIQHEDKLKAIGVMAFLTKTIKEEEERKKAKADADKAAAITLQHVAEDAKKSSKEILTTSASTRCTTSQKVYLPDETKIVGTDHGVRVLQSLPPVCIPVGKQSERLADVVLYSTLQGTPLDEAKDTQVGSILPKFEYRRYIEIDVPGTTVPPEKRADG